MNLRGAWLGLNVLAHRLKEEVRPALWDLRQSHFDRYVKASSTMPPLSPELEVRVVDEAQRIYRALGWECRAHRPHKPAAQRVRLEIPTL